MDFNLLLLVRIMPRLLMGVKLTLQIAIGALAIGLTLGLILALMRISRVILLSAVARAYVDFIRGTPSLMQLFLVYYGLPSLGVVIDPIPAGVLALGLNSSAYIAEILRAGIESIEKGQWEAGFALGMTSGQVMRLIILPQAIRRVIPPLLNEFVALVKETAIASVIAIPELLRRGQEVIATYANVFTPLVGVSICYLVITITGSLLAQRIERRLRASEG